MPRDPDAVALRLDKPLGRAWLGAFLILLLVIGAAEAASRLQFLQDRLPRPSLGTGHRQFEIQWARLNDFIAQEGPPDCIVLGNSTVRSGIDPEILSAAYQAQTGTPIRCFNFGVDGLDAPTAASLARLLVQKAQPHLLILEVTTLGNGRASMYISSSPWFQEQLGHPNFDSWLIENSRAYDYYLLLLDLYETPDFYTHNQQWETQINAQGYHRATRVLENAGEAPNPEMEARLFKEIAMRWPETGDEYQAFYASLDQITQLREGVQIVAIETPLHPTFLLYLEGGEQQYTVFVDQIRQYLDGEAIEFYPVKGILQIPDDHWQDRNHLNYKGAQIFSQWLGQKLGQAVNQGRLANPTR